MFVWVRHGEAETEAGFARGQDSLLFVARVSLVGGLILQELPVCALPHTLATKRRHIYRHMRSKHPRVGGQQHVPIVCVCASHVPRTHHLPMGGAPGRPPAAHAHAARTDQRSVITDLC